MVAAAAGNVSAAASNAAAETKRFLKVMQVLHRQFCGRKAELDKQGEGKLLLNCGRRVSCW
jgi:hypothetical protein